MGSTSVGEQEANRARRELHAELARERAAHEKADKTAAEARGQEQRRYSMWDEQRRRAEKAEEALDRAHSWIELAVEVLPSEQVEKVNAKVREQNNKVLTRKR